MTEETDQTAPVVVDLQTRFRALLAEGLQQNVVLDIMHEVNDGATPAEIEAAKEQYGYRSDDQIEIDDNALTSRGEDGVWVMMWGLVPYTGKGNFDALESPLWGITVPDDDAKAVTAIKLDTYEEAKSFANDLVGKSAYLVLADDEAEALALGVVYATEGGPASLRDAGCEEEALSEDDEVYYLRRIT